MKTIKKEVTNEIIINKSKFITIIIPFTTIEQIDDILKNIKNKYKDATHYCYGYVINGKEKMSDDGEPSGTAGMPILNVIKKNDLTNVICIVVRYFGGIKLGAGGLTRAYSNSAKEVIQKCKFGTLTKGYEIEIEFDYDKSKEIDYILKDIEISKTYDEKVKYKFNSYDENIINKLKKYIKNIREITLIKDD